MKSYKDKVPKSTIVNVPQMNSNKKKLSKNVIVKVPETSSSVNKISKSNDFRDLNSKILIQVKIDKTKNIKPKNNESKYAKSVLNKVKKRCSEMTSRVSHCFHIFNKNVKTFFKKNYKLIILILSIMAILICVLIVVINWKKPTNRKLG